MRDCRKRKAEIKKNHENNNNEVKKNRFDPCKYCQGTNHLSDDC